jgi:hypothetical protein
MDLRDFENILYFFSEKELEELQAAIDKRRSLTFDEESLRNLVKQSDYSANGVESVSPEAPLQHPA